MRDEKLSMASGCPEEQKGQPLTTLLKNIKCIPKMSCCLQYIFINMYVNIRKYIKLYLSIFQTKEMCPTAKG